MQRVIELIDNISPVGLVESPVFDSIEEIAFDIFEEQVEIKIVFGLFIGKYALSPQIQQISFHMSKWADEENALMVTKCYFLMCNEQ